MFSTEYGQLRYQNGYQESALSPTHPLAQKRCHEEQIQLKRL